MESLQQAYPTVVDQLAIGLDDKNKDVKSCGLKASSTTGGSRRHCFHALRVLDLTVGEDRYLERMRLLFKSARCQMSDGRYQEAEKLLTESVNNSETLFDPESAWGILRLAVHDKGSRRRKSK